MLIDLKDLGESPVRARAIANPLSDGFVAMVRGLESPERGETANARVDRCGHGGCSVASNRDQACRTIQSLHHSTQTRELVGCADRRTAKNVQYWRQRADYLQPNSSDLSAL